MNATEEGCFTSRNKGRLYALLREAAATGRRPDCLELFDPLPPIWRRCARCLTSPSSRWTTRWRGGGRNGRAYGRRAGNRPKRDRPGAGQDSCQCRNDGPPSRSPGDLVPGAIDALNGGDRETHDRLLLEAARPLRGKQEVIVLAQASMAHVDRRLPTSAAARCSPAPPPASGRPVRWSSSSGARAG